MRKVKFVIDDKKYFMDKYKEHPTLQKDFAKQDSFQAVYTLIGNEKFRISMS